MTGPGMTALTPEGPWSVTCDAHSLDRTVQTEKHASNLLALHLRIDHDGDPDDRPDGYNLTAAAAVLTAADSDTLLDGERRGAIAMWRALTGAKTARDAIRLAASYADDTHPTIAHVAPF